MQILIYPGVVMADAKVDGYEWKEDFFEMADEHKHIIKNSLLLLGQPKKLQDCLLSRMKVCQRQF